MADVTEPSPVVHHGRGVVVIPCYNEFDRLDRNQVEELLEEPGLEVLFVDDGSSDQTGRMLQAIHDEHPSRVRIRSLPINQGKAEAVRQGVLEALEASAEFVGYLDADFATPASEYKRLQSLVASSPNVSVVLGSRVSMLGTSIERRPSRHYLGRLFATAASLALGMNVYDTQCGLKIFRTSPRLLEALNDPFTTKWAFDVELLSRLVSDKYASKRIELSELNEVPLLHWRDVAGSKVSATGAIRMAKDIGAVWWNRRNENASA